MVVNTDCFLDVIFFTAKALVAASVEYNINLMQQAYHNSRYGLCRAKVQHVLQADRICYSLTCHLCQHDLSVLQSSSMITMLSVMFVNNYSAHPLKTVTDTAHHHTRHFFPLHTSLEL